jgi:hypothetical protein
MPRSYPDTERMGNSLASSDSGPGRRDPRPSSVLLLTQVNGAGDLGIYGCGAVGLKHDGPLLGWPVSQHTGAPLGRRV